MQLLVSVRSAAEADAALAGGAGLIDVKEPLHGALGRAGDAVIAAVVRQVGGRRPVSAALGELANPAESAPYAGPGLAYAKWGLFGMASCTDWRQRLAEAGRRLAEVSPGCRVVAVAYADWQWAGAPAVEDVCAFVCEQPGGVRMHRRGGQPIGDNENNVDGARRTSDQAFARRGVEPPPGCCGPVPHGPLPPDPQGPPP